MYKKLLPSKNAKSRAGSCVETVTMSRTHELINQALEKVNKIQKIGQNVKANKDLYEVQTQLSTAVNYISAIKHIGGLQTHDFSIELEAAIAVLQECESLFKKLPGSSMKSSQIGMEQIRYEKQLKPMQVQLDKALQQISLRVLETPAGLKAGHLVELNVLNETNTRVEPIFKKSLVLVDFLKKEGKMGGKDINGTIVLEPAKFEAFRLSISQQSASQAPGIGNVTEPYVRAVIRGNTAGNNMTTVTGHIGFEPGYTASYTGTSQFLDNTLGNDGVLVTGDIGGQAAADMINQIFRNRA